MVEEIPLAEITIGDRFRKDLGDIASLATSIATVGLLHPILVTTDYALIVGRRRLAAYAHLERKTIPTLVVDLDDPFTAEVDENEQRKAYTASECVGIGRAREERDRKNAEQRKSDAVKRGGRSNKKLGVVSTPSLEQGKARDITSSHAGMGWQAYQKAKVVVEAAEQDPDLQELVEKMDRTGNVSAAYREIPPYIFLERPDLAPKTKPKKPRKLSYDTLIEKLDALVLDTVFPQARSFDEEQRNNLRTLLQSYVTMLDHLKDETDDAA